MPEKSKDIKQELDTLAPGLRPILEEDDELWVPVGYDADLQRSILRRTVNKKPILIRFYRPIGIAAALLVFILARIWWPVSASPEVSFDEQLATLDTETLFEIIENDLDVTAEEIIEAGIADADVMDLQEGTISEVAGVEFDKNEQEPELIDAGWLDSISDQDWLELLEDNIGI